MIQKTKDQVIISLMLILIFLVSYNIYVQSEHSDNVTNTKSELKINESSIKLSGKIFESAHIINNTIIFKIKSGNSIFNIINESSNITACNKLVKDVNIKIEGVINTKKTDKKNISILANVIETDNILIIKN